MAIKTMTFMERIQNIWTGQKWRVLLFVTFFYLTTFYERFYDYEYKLWGK